jgi:hypothetical protein
MELSQKEMKMIRYLRTQHEAWHQTKRIILVGGILFLAISIYGFLKSFSLLLILPNIALSAYFLSYSIGGWNGRPEISILLKLAELYLNQKEKSP